ncbi:TPA: hypothetical protein N2D99_002380 [Clostridium botulinum]|nr:hypothetical protein [Clostridium botulinum]
MKNKIKNILIAIIFVLFISPLFAITVSAKGDSSTLKTNTVTPIQSQDKDTSSTTKKFDYSPDKELPKVGIDQASNWAERKGQDIVNFLQIVVQPFSVIIFIGCAFITLFGTFGHGGLVAKGIIGMGIAVAMYTAVLFAPELLQFFSRWLAS